MTNSAPSRQAGLWFPAAVAGVPLPEFAAGLDNSLTAQTLAARWDGPPV